MKRSLQRIAFFAPFLLACAAMWAQDWSRDDDDWLRYTALSFAVPFTSWDYDVGTDYDAYIPTEFESTGYTFDYQTYHVSPNIGFATMIRCGFGGWKGSYVLTVTSNEDEEDDEEIEECETDNVNGFMLYFKLGLGKAFELADRRLAIIPTVGVGLDAYIMTNAEDAFEVYEEDEKVASLSYSTYDFTLDVFLNVMAAVMFTEHIGLSVSFELSLPALGVDIYRVSDESDESNDVRMMDNFSAVNFMPAVGICFRL